MWILDSLSNVQLKRPFFLLWISLGAVYLLLATFFYRNALYPATYSIVTLCVWLLWQRQRSVRNILIVPAIAAVSFFLVPRYFFFFCAIFAFATARFIFAENFRWWKVAASSGLLFVTAPIVATWQSIPSIANLVPAPVPHLIYAAIHAFCIQFALLPLQLRKDSVLEAFATYSWKTSSQAYHLATEMVALYTKIKSLLRERESNPKIQQDLEDYTERLMEQCHRLQEISTELSNISIVSVEQQIVFLKEKVGAARDFSTRMQYEQALQNKQKQLEHYERLALQREHLLSCIINFNSSLENVRFAYANQNWTASSATNENIDMFMDLVRARAEAL